MNEYIYEIIATPTYSTLKWILEEASDEFSEGFRELRDSLNASGGTLVVQALCEMHNSLPALQFTATGKWKYPTRGFTLSISVKYSMK